MNVLFWIIKQYTMKDEDRHVSKFDGTVRQVSLYPAYSRDALCDQICSPLKLFHHSHRTRMGTEPYNHAQRKILLFNDTILMIE